ncbi:MAG: PspC domain-containing protein [Oscillospiraceae bacterium]|nr:PspC domain-containing protein [Oscillospiraceae bacterium]
MERELYRIKKGKILFGVCAGMGEYMNLSPWIVRAIFAGMSLFFFGGVFVYIASIFMYPMKPEKASDQETEE